MTIDGHYNDNDNAITCTAPKPDNTTVSLQHAFGNGHATGTAAIGCTITATSTV